MANTIFDVVDTLKSKDVGVLPEEKEIALQIINLFHKNKIKIARANVIIDSCKEVIQYSTVGDFIEKEAGIEVQVQNQPMSLKTYNEVCNLTFEELKKSKAMW